MSKKKKVENPLSLIGGKSEGFPELPNSQIVSSGVDWYTATTTSKETGFAWFEAYVKYRSEFTTQQEKDCSLHGYRGSQIGGFRIMQHQKQGFLVMLSGEAADRFWHGMVPVIGKVTRLDLQVTVSLRRPFPQLVAAYLQGLGSSDYEKRQYGVILNSIGGQTLYVGSRVSQDYGRIYDKGVEAGIGLEGTMWRYEVETKKPKANVLAQSVYEHFKDRPGTLAQVIASYVWNWYFDRGIRPIFSPGEAPPFKVSVGAAIEEKQTGRRLMWLRSQVRPTVRELLGQGHSKEVLEALGMTDYMQRTFVTDMDEENWNLWRHSGQGNEEGGLGDLHK